MSAEITNTNTGTNVGVPINQEHEIKQYFVVNNDLKMGHGKIAGQVSHVCGIITEEIIRASYECLPTPSYVYDYMKWRTNGMAKIILKGTEEQLQMLIKDHGARYIIDAGRTQIPANSLTVVGFYPGAPVQDVLKDYKLL